MKSHFVWLFLILAMVAVWHFVERVRPAPSLVPAARLTCISPPLVASKLGLELPPGGAVQVLDSTPKDALLKIDMRGFKRLRLTALFSGPSKRWSLDVGDSSTNDGYGGDAGTRFFDAEAEIRDGVLDTYGSDVLGNAPRRLKTWDKAVAAGDTIKLEIANEELCFDGPSGPKSLHDKALFALAGQLDPDNGKACDYDVFVGVNRVISGRGDRNGSGVGHLKVELID